MTQTPYQQAPYQQGPAPQNGGYQQGYQPPAQQQAPYQQAPQQGQYTPQAYQPAPQQGQAPYQQGQPNGYQPQAPAQAPYQQAPQQQQGYQPVGQPGPVQGNQQDQQASRQTMQAYQPGEDGSDPMLEDFTVFRGAAPYLSFSDPACTGYERGGIILAVGTDYAKKFKTNDPLFWEYGPKKGQQRMCRVLILQTQERIPGRQDDTGIRTLELMDGKDIFKAAAMAVRAVNPNKPSFEVGGQLYITRTGKRPSQGGNEAVTYIARYVPAPADYVNSDMNLVAENMLHGPTTSADIAAAQQTQAPSPEAQQLQQAAAYVASTPQGPVNGGQQAPQYQPAPQQAPAAAQGGQPAWMAQGPALQQTAPQGQQPAPWMAQGPGQQAPAPQAPAGQQAPAPWMAQGQQQPQGQPNGYQPTPSHPFGPSTQQPMPSPYPPQGQQG